MAELRPDPPPFRPQRPLTIGLMGGIASGKSAVAARFATRGLCVVDADASARQVVERADIRLRIEQRFGREVFTADGRLDRPALAARVFADEAARRDLEAITHPPIRAELGAAIEAALRRGRSVVIDAPLLFEGGLIERCDVCVFADAPLEVRRARARERGWADGELERREAAQAPLDAKRRRARFTVPTGGALDETHSAVDRILDALATGQTDPRG